MANLKEKQIVQILKDFRGRTNILCSILLNEDGLIIALDQAQMNEDDEYHLSFSAICSGIVALAENGIETIKEENNVKKISIQAGEQLDKEGFTIILQSVTKNIKLSIMFPTYLNFGVILFELNQTIQRLSEYFSIPEQIKNLDGVSTLMQ